MASLSNEGAPSALLTSTNGSAPRRVLSSTPSSFDEEGLANRDVVGHAWPLRVLQVLGVWQPRSVPSFLAWAHYLLLVLVQVWFVIWLVYASARAYTLAVAVLHGLDQVVFALLWVALPYVLRYRAEALVNTIDYVQRYKAAPVALLNAAYATVFTLALAPQVAYFVFEGVPFVRSVLVPSLPWNQGHAPDTFSVIDTAVLSLGMLLNVLCINATLLYLAMAAHLQSFQINDFLKTNLLHRQSAPNIPQLKTVLHLAVQSLRNGNKAAEPLNTLIVMGVLLEMVEVIAKVVIDDKWEVQALLPLAILVMQVLLLLIPPAYVTRCWDRAFQKLLALHALALSQEDELSAIIAYMTAAYRGYTISNVRIDVHFIVYLCYLLVALLAVKVQRDVHFWMPNAT